MVHLPDSIRGGANPRTVTVEQLINETMTHYPARAGVVLGDLCDRAGVDTLSDDFDLFLDSPELAAFITLSDVRALADDPNGEVVA